MQTVRTALATAALLCAAVACSSTISTPNSPVPHPVPTGTPAAIKHIVILFQENRSFNTMFMGFPGAVSASHGPCEPWQPPKQWGEKEVCANGGPVKLKMVELESNGAPGGHDIEHEHSTFLTEYNGGKMDGFGQIYQGTTGHGPPAREYPYAYVDPKEVKPYWDMASQYTLADHMFSTETSDSFPAHQMIIAGTTKLSASESLVDEPTSLIWGCDANRRPGRRSSLRAARLFRIRSSRVSTNTRRMADSLDAANVSWSYYVQAISGKNADFAGGRMERIRCDQTRSIRCRLEKECRHSEQHGVDGRSEGHVAGRFVGHPHVARFRSPGQRLP